MDRLGVVILVIASSGAPLVAQKPLCETVGDVGVGAGHRCVLPFMFKGVTYDSCTSVEHNTLWCATHVNVTGASHKVDNWGNCKCLQPCTDTIGFVDAHGLHNPYWGGTCPEWAPRHCQDAVSKWGYTHEEQNAVLTNCPASCGLCLAESSSAFNHSVAHNIQARLNDDVKRGVHQTLDNASTKARYHQEFASKDVASTTESGYPEYGLTPGSSWSVVENREHEHGAMNTPVETNGPVEKPEVCPRDHQHSCPKEWKDGGYHCQDHGGCRKIKDGPFPRKDCKQQCVMLSTNVCIHGYKHSCPKEWKRGGYHCQDHGGCRALPDGPFPEADCQKQCVIWETASILVQMKDQGSVEDNVENEAGHDSKFWSFIIHYLVILWCVGFLCVGYEVWKQMEPGEDEDADEDEECEDGENSVPSARSSLIVDATTPRSFIMTPRKQLPALGTLSLAGIPIPRMLTFPMTPSFSLLPVANPLHVQYTSLQQERLGHMPQDTFAEPVACSAHPETIWRAGVPPQPELQYPGIQTGSPTGFLPIGG